MLFFGYIGSIKREKLTQMKFGRITEGVAFFANMPFEMVHVREQETLFPDSWKAVLVCNNID